MSDDPTPPEDPESTELGDPWDSAPPERVGPYKILQKIGEGGMGEVYLAEQEEPIRRRVALKLIKLGMDTKQVIARFEAERQALAIINHPHVAKAFDAGATEQGRPYFAMEYVKGEPITKYCDKHRLTTGERLRLFMQVCEGIQHAHQKGIIHRDIKPTNVLVSVEGDKPIPKIIDFGVAKATEHRLTEKTVFTQMGVLIGTPEYMSPEQAEMTTLDIDTRTDVYSLGVLLYELLVGALPFEPRALRRAGFDEIRRVIREVEPSKPSTRVSTLGETATKAAMRRKTDLPALRRELRGDLDWITMKALEKDRTRRYGAPSELADDIRRHLRHEPVLAGPPNAAYRAGKFVRRHRVGVGVGVLLLAVLVAFTVTTTVQSRRIVREARTSERVSEFLANMLGSVEPEAFGQLLVTDLRDRIEAANRERGATDEAVEEVLASLAEAMRGVNATDAGLRLLDEQILSRAGKTIEQELTEEPRIAGRLEHTLGATYWKLGLYPQAERHAKRAVEIRERELGRDHPDTLGSMNSLGLLYSRQGRYDEAEPLCIETLEAMNRVLGDDHPDTLVSMNNLANVYWYQGRYDEAEPLYLEALAAKKRVLGNDHPDTLGSMGNLGLLYFRQGRYDEAEPFLLETLEAMKRVLGDNHPDTLSSIHNLALLYSRQGRYDEAEPLQLESVEARRRVLGEDHPDTLWSMNDLAVLYWRQNRYDEAEPLYLETLEARKRVLGDDHPDTLLSMNNLGVVYVQQSRYDEAEALHLETLEARRRVLGENHPDTADTLYSLACIEAIRDNAAKAMDWLRQSVGAGYANTDWMSEDSDLESLHGSEFDALLEQVRRNSEAGRSE